MNIAWILCETCMKLNAHFIHKKLVVSTSVYKFDTVVRGQHVYKSVWTSLTNWCSKTRKCILVWEDDERNKYTINDWL